MQPAMQAPLHTFDIVKFLHVFWHALFPQIENISFCLPSANEKNHEIIWKNAYIPWKLHTSSAKYCKYAWYDGKVP